MKVVILAGGWGTRLAEETRHHPKPMVAIGGKPILWHIMMHYHAYGFSNFVIALGYKGDVIKRWMIEMAKIQGDIHVSTSTGRVLHLQNDLPDWNVDLVETGLYSNTGGRIKALLPTIGTERFFLAWGDGVSNIDLNALLASHKAHGKLATMVIVRPPARFGHVEIQGNQIIEFTEKPQTSEGWINGGVFVLEPEVLNYIDGAETQFEKAPLERLARDGQLMAFKHGEFWQCMDTLRDKQLLEKIWAAGDAPWITWKNKKCVSLSPAIAAI